MNQKNQLIQGKGHFKIPSCKANWDNAHVRLLSEVIVTIIKTFPDSVIFREHYVPAPLDRRADALVLVKKDNKGLCLLLEVVHEEKEEYLKGKIRSWRDWNDTEYLSNLFKVKIPNFEIITLREGERNICEKLPPLD